MFVIKYAKQHWLHVTCRHNVGSQSCSPASHACYGTANRCYSSSCQHGKTACHLQQRESLFTIAHPGQHKLCLFSFHCKHLIILPLYSVKCEPYQLHLLSFLPYTRSHNQQQPSGHIARQASIHAALHTTLTGRDSLACKLHADNWTHTCCR